MAPTSLIASPTAPWAEHNRGHPQEKRDGQGKQTHHASLQKRSSHVEGRMF